MPGKNYLSVNNKIYLCCLKFRMAILFEYSWNFQKIELEILKKTIFLWKKLVHKYILEQESPLKRAYTVVCKSVLYSYIKIGTFEKNFLRNFLPNETSLGWFLAYSYIFSDLSLVILMKSVYYIIIIYKFKRWNSGYSK